VIGFEEVVMSTDLDSLYPFLYERGPDSTAVLDSVLTEVRRSTAEKMTEIGALRQHVLEEHADKLASCAQAMAAAFDSEGRLFAFGNGGSSTDALDVASTFMDPPPGGRPLPALCLTNDIAVVTALSNDIGFDVIFARQLAASARSGDIAVGLSTSGNSGNVIAAFDEAARRGLLTVGLAGYDGGQMAEAESIEHLFVVPSSSVHASRKHRPPFTTRCGN
jgi:D-sedoheptulose 7-phosphate isomerase